MNRLARKGLLQRSYFCPFQRFQYQLKFRGTFLFSSNKVGPGAQRTGLINIALCIVLLSLLCLFDKHSLLCLLPRRACGRGSGDVRVTGRRPPSPLTIIVIINRLPLVSLYCNQHRNKHNNYLLFYIKMALGHCPPSPLREIPLS